MTEKCKGCKELEKQWEETVDKWSHSLFVRRTLESQLAQERCEREAAEAREASWIEYYKDNRRCERHDAEGCECDGTILEPLDISPRAEAIQKVLEAAKKCTSENDANPALHLPSCALYEGERTGECDCGTADLFIAVRELKETEG